MSAHNWTLSRLEKELQAYLVRCFNETENTNENTNLRELADVKEALPSGGIATEALSVSLESLSDTSHWFPIKLIHIAARDQSYRKMFVFTKPHGHKTIEVEFRIRVERPLLPRSR